MAAITKADRAALRRRIPPLYESGRSIRSIARELGCDRGTICRILQERGMEPRTALDQRTRNILSRDVVIDGPLRELINGLLLGDGSIAIRLGHHPRFELTSKSWEYARHVAMQLTNAGVQTGIGAHVRGYARLWTAVWPALTLIAPGWYGAGTKKLHVPAGLSLSPVTVLHWYLGDGSLAKMKGRRPAGYLYTNSFPVKDVERLADGLCQLGIVARPLRCGAPQSHEWRIYLRHSAVVALLAYIGPSPIQEYSYKWEVNDVHHEDGRMAKIKKRDFGQRR